jgi:CBS domain-containing protein
VEETLVVVLKVKDIMTTDVITINPNENIEYAARVMSRFGISSLIAQSDERNLGILTERDVLIRVIASSRNPQKATVGEVMTNNLISTYPNTTIKKASKIMLKNRIKKLAVLDPEDNKKVIGIISMTDIANHQPLIMQEYSRLKAKDRMPKKVKTLIGMDEGQHLEFKAGLRYNSRRNCLDSDLEFNCLKTICAFLNAEGGDLLIGVADDKRVVGIESEYVFFKMNRDKFQDHLINQISHKLGDTCHKNIKFSFHVLYNKEICRIHIRPSLVPVFLQHNGKQAFYVRTGNGSRAFQISDATRYMVERWPDIMNIASFF